MTSRHVLLAFSCTCLAGIWLAIRLDSGAKANRPPPPVRVGTPAPPPATPQGDGDASPSVEVSRWVYDQSRDDMRGTLTRLACITSSYALTFSPPYAGGSTAELCLRAIGNRFDVYLTISRGQFLCHPSSCPLALKVDDGPVIEVGGDPPQSADADMIFLHRSAMVRQRLLQARRFIVEATFYREGTRQMVFENAQGLAWATR